MHEEFNSKALLAAERWDAHRAGALFAKACVEGDVAALYFAAGTIHATVDGWAYAMKLVGRLPCVSDDIKIAFLRIWIESKFLPLSVGNRPIMAKALRVLMAGAYHGPALQLYRGTTARERRRHLYGFSWTTRLDIARDKFAQRLRPAPGGAVVLSTLAPPEAILLVREQDGYFDEGEVVVDPFQLGPVKLVARL